MLLRSLGTILFILASLTEPVFAQARFPFAGRVTTDRVYVRAGQNVNFETVATVNKNDTLIVLEESYGWLKVKLPPQSETFISAEYAELLTPEIGVVKVDKLNVRCAANTAATVLGRLVRGDRFYVRAREGDWLSIKPLDGLSGWVKVEFVEPRRGEKVPAVLYPQPPSVEPPAPPVPAAPPVVPAKPFLLKELKNGQFEVSGVLRSEGGVYRVFKGDEVACVVDAPAVALEGFAGRSVKVRGKLKIEEGAVPGADPVLSLTKINFIF